MGNFVCALLRTKRSKTANESSACNSSSTRPVDNTARTDSNGLVIPLEWLQDRVLQVWCANIHWGLRKTGPSVTALLVC